MPISGSDEILFSLGLCHCWRREVQTKSSGIDLALSSSSEKQDTLGPQHDYKILETQLHRCKMMQEHHRVV